MANTICTTRQFTVTDGVLGLSRAAMPRVVLEATQQSINDGPVTEHSSQANPKIFIEQRCHWKNDFDVPVWLQVQVQRARRTMTTTNPHHLFLRERWTTAVGTDSGTQVMAPEPRVDQTWDTEWGGGQFQAWREGEGWPKIVTTLSAPAATSTLGMITVPVGQSLDFRLRVALITDAYAHVPWGDQTKQEPFQHVATMFAFSNTTRFLATPIPV